MKNFIAYVIFSIILSGIYFWLGSLCPKPLAYIGCLIMAFGVSIFQASLKSKTTGIILVWIPFFAALILQAAKWSGINLF